MFMDKPLARRIVRQKYPLLECQAVFARLAAESFESLGGITFKAARSEWLTELANLNRNPTDPAMSRNDEPDGATKRN
ncbi:MAG: hypothetical protein A2Z34_05620 [Planctomycetes bacterium RBG_16_59_8]|nr:MAG: hypothetical protein A2Z34_05620 [Planctomycetes bacterium RBG_16_59_8]